jgi:hypothetical protein
MKETAAPQAPLPHPSPHCPFADPQAASSPASLQSNHTLVNQMSHVRQGAERPRTAPLPTSRVLELQTQLLHTGCLGSAEQNMSVQKKFSFHKVLRLHLNIF